MANHRFTSDMSVCAEPARVGLQVPGLQTPSFEGETPDITVFASRFPASVSDIHEHTGFPLL